MNSKKAPSILICLIPAAMILAAYATYLFMSPSKTISDIERLEREVTQLQSRQIPRENILEMSGQLTDAKEQLSEVKEEIKLLQSEASNLLRGRIARSEGIQASRHFSQLMQVCGVKIVSESTEMTTRNLLDSLDRAAKDLSNLVVETEDDDENSVGNLPADLPSDVNPLEFLEEQRLSRRAQSELARRGGFELILVGDYSSMLKGLTSVNTCCPEILVTGVSFAQPPAGSSNNLRLWKVQILLHPAFERIDQPTIPKKPQQLVKNL
ncbi:Hypothetical protein PBC10988_6230 [Planctomycetales bacterium 10988]|nr:Hypothetical protein PBC10988_6230 [Planctomycetales bacterium 10988]